MVKLQVQKHNNIQCFFLLYPIEGYEKSNVYCSRIPDELELKAGTID